jgi:probable HAF family extracellular repeat protein
LTLVAALSAPPVLHAQLEYVFYNLGNFGAVHDSEPLGINDAGMVVGYSTALEDPTSRGFIWDNGVLIEISGDALDPDAVIWGATDISRNGIVAAAGWDGKSNYNSNFIWEAG